MNTSIPPDLDDDNVLSFHAPGAGKAGLTKLVAQRAKDVTSDHERFESRKRVWVRKLNELFDQIQRIWLHDLIRAGQVQATPHNMQLMEEHIGEYQVPTLVLGIADSTVRFTPVGTLIAGASGRVDMRGPNGTAVILLDAAAGKAELPFEERDLTWNLVTMAPKVARTPLNEDTFSDALSSII